MGKQPNPNAGTTARKRRTLRNLQSLAHPSRLLYQNDKRYKELSYRTEIVAKTTEEKFLARLRESSFRRLLRRRTQGSHALSHARANYERAETPALKGSLWPQVSRCKDFLAAVDAEIARRGTVEEHLERLANLTPREIKHKLYHGHKAWKRAISRREHCGIPSLALRTREESELHHRNVTMTTALRAKQNEKA